MGRGPRSRPVLPAGFGCANVKWRVPKESANQAREGEPRLQSVFGVNPAGRSAQQIRGKSWRHVCGSLTSFDRGKLKRRVLMDIPVLLLLMASKEQLAAACVQSGVHSKCTYPSSRLVDGAARLALVQASATQRCLPRKIRTCLARR